MSLKTFSLVGLVAIWYVLCCHYVLTNLQFFPFFGNKPFALELFQTDFDIPVGIIFILSIINIFLLFILIRKFFSQKISFFTIIFFASSWWTIYLGVFNSLYPLVIFFGLLFGIGLFWKSGIGGYFLEGIGILGLLFSSFLTMVPLIILLFLNLKFKLFPFKAAIFANILLVIIILGLAVLTIIDPGNAKHVIGQEVTIFQDVGLINAVNRFQGESNNAHIGLIGRLIENKYSYLSLKTINNFMVHFFPFTYFTSNFKILSFSQESPILIGLIIPFFFGLGEIVKQKKWPVYLILFILLILPSFLASNAPDLNRLFLVAPLIFLVVAIGFENLQIHKNFFWLAVVLIFSQEIMILTDIYLREGPRLLPMVIRAYGKKYF
jgi:hypothetical protein